MVFYLLSKMVFWLVSKMVCWLVSKIKERISYGKHKLKLQKRTQLKVMENFNYKEALINVNRLKMIIEKVSSF
jgi:hypothetical protein